MCEADHFGHFDGGNGDYNYDHHVNCDDHHTITSMIRDLKTGVWGRSKTEASKTGSGAEPVKVYF